MKILLENAIHDLAVPKFHYCLMEQNVPIFASNPTALLMGVLNCFYFRAQGTLATPLSKSSPFQ